MSVVAHVDHADGALEISVSLDATSLLMFGNRARQTELVKALKAELERCGAFVIEKGDSLEVFSDRALHGAEIETYNDHRMAMCFAILGLKVSGIKIKNPACVKKSFPNFFQKLAAPPPHGLGATILDARTARALSHDELFAE